VPNFTTNWELYDTMYSRKKQTRIDEPIIRSKDIQKKIQLIKKAFH
jgi:hypothetical protein